MKILVLGKNGQLAQALAARNSDKLAIVALGREACDLLRPDSIAAALAREAPNAVINAAAYTAVDKAESEPDAAMALNAVAPGAMAAACAARGTPFVHVSTDYVFDGLKTSPYVETDPIAPQSVYGRTKAEGEAAVTHAGGEAAILRTSWVYASTGANFVRTMLRLAATREELGVVADQLGRPTWARDLADACLASAIALANRDAAARGVFHYGGAGDATWADFADAIFAEAAKRGMPSARVNRITTADYPTPAKRPANSRLATTKIEAALGLRARPWREALALCMDEIAAQPA
ncbi:MAG TPA: dTDP-4-dehydrorhamnose reductase [Caulobacterales bacterium]|nr:dTDP-4-dehydrorhamnose reductase [Caulobacterales bacterium]